MPVRNGNENGITQEKRDDWYRLAEDAPNQRRSKAEKKGLFSRLWDWLFTGEKKEEKKQKDEPNWDEMFKN